MLRAAALIASAALVSGCAALPMKAPVKPPIGALYSQVRAPLQHDFGDTKLGSKIGSTSVIAIHDILLTGQLFATGDASVETAARNAGITTIHHVDYEIMSVLGVFARFTIFVYGD